MVSVNIHGQLWVVIFVVVATVAGATLRFLAEWFKYREAVLSKSRSKRSRKRRKLSKRVIPRRLRKRR